MSDKRTREEVYDEDISPMMVKIIQTCKDAGIPMVCDFALDDDCDDGEPPGLHCTTALVHPHSNDKTRRIAEATKPVKPQWAAFTVHADGRREQVAGSSMPDKEPT